MHMNCFLNSITLLNYDCKQIFVIIAVLEYMGIIIIGKEQ